MNTGRTHSKNTSTYGYWLTGILAIATAFAACSTGSGRQQSQTTQYRPQANKHNATTEHSGPTVSATQIPVLCYHQIRDWKSNDSKSARVYIVPLNQFKEQMQMLQDSGYHTIMPDELVSALKEHKELPQHSVLITFDDGTEPQYTSALPILDEAGFKAVFFIMTITINKPGYLGAKEIADLSARDHLIGCHTLDHRNVKQYKGDDWEKEMNKPTATLEKICGKPVKYFAYPFGLWDPAAIPELKQRGFVAAFQLWGRIDPQDPLYTIRRTLVSGYWSNKEFMQAIRKAENSPRTNEQQESMPMAAL